MHIYQKNNYMENPFNIINGSNPSDIIYGGIDGTITTFAIIAGAIGSNQSSNTIIILAISSLLADGFSMGVSAYESEIAAPENALSRGIVTFLSFIVIGFIPIIVFYVNKDKSFDVKRYSTLFATLICLFVIGMFKEYITVKQLGYTTTTKDIILSGSKTLLLGTISGMIAYQSAKYIESCLRTKTKKGKNTKEDPEN